MANEKEKRHFFTAPVGISGYTELNNPSQKYNKYSVKMRWAPSVIADIQGQLEKLADEEMAKLASTDKKKAKLYTVEYPIKEGLDNDGEPTGLMEAGFNLKAVIEWKDKKTGEPKMKINKVHFFDAQGTRIPASKVPQLWGGSKLAVAFEARAGVWDGQKKVGVGLELSAIQIIEAVQGGKDGMTAEQFGFGKQDGFSAGGSFGSEPEETTSEDTGAYDNGDF